MATAQTKKMVVEQKPPSLADQMMAKLQEWEVHVSRAQMERYFTDRNGELDEDTRMVIFMAEDTITRDNHLSSLE